MSMKQIRNDNLKEIPLYGRCGNVVTIEGVTCIFDDIDYGNYKIANGKIQVSDKPGFGMKILI